MSSASIESRSRPAEPIAESDSQQQREQCPRCESTNTKFCYYNNYNTSQPRHFCKSCRRYWTLGGSLRNIPIGGSSRKRLRTNVYPSHISKQSRTGTGSTNIVPSRVFGLNRFFPAQLVSFGGPFLQSRAGFELELGLGSQSGSGFCSNSLEENGLGFGLGNGPITWPLSLMNEEGGLFGNEPNIDMWKMEIGRMEDDVTVPAIGMW